ncbi:MAG: PIG-U family protein [Planctomycetaceae bacterium]|nr:PIG-U family protein [Planctomycetaceae bacterium]
MLPTTWFYVSTLIILALFFKFNRFWSVRNLDLLVLVLLTPGLLMLAMHNDQWGYAWLFGVGFFLVVRLIFDNLMVRRPLLEPNLTPGGLTFACFFLVFFIVAAITINRGDQIDTVRTVRLEQILTTRHLQHHVGMNTTLTIPQDELANLPPGFRPFLAFAERTNLALAPPDKIRNEIVRSTLPFPLPVDNDNPHVLVWTGENATTSSLKTDGGQTSPLLPIPPTTLLSETPSPTSDSLSLPPSTTLRIELESSTPIQTTTALRPDLSTLSLIMSAALLGHLAIVFGFLYIGHCHFGNIRTGIACATLYLLHPYTNQMIGRLDHLIPAALILWGVALYRRPFFSGFSVGTATALVCYPVCLVPLWCSFYWKRGWIRFLSGVGSALILFAVLLLFSPTALGSYQEQFIHMLGKSTLFIFSKPDGFWEYYDMIYRVPLLAIFFVLCFGMILWPSHKHLATLLSCSSLLLLGVQFWQLHQGGLYMAWYLPMLILTIFRPNLEDRTAQSSVVP